MRCKFWQKRGWPYIIGGMVGVMLVIGGTMMLDTVTENPYQSYQNTTGENPAGEETTITIQVAPTLEERTGIGSRQCMLIREMPPAADGGWGLFYDQIEGFAYEEGYLWTLRVKITGSENPPADASTLRYELVEVVEKKPVA
ncbi:DUF4377 domain-containing protein [Methanogenium sp. S4BF]|uniref:DUF4377 domain-containing protein n=1 Tax=Methanogenium sp. S4BF TaxID=1789226 RepID=UPI002417A2AE|nr:DUF4377 domain-containing protein [Methanogenium sp. S4BF]WFN33777.1 DUF4377 domain-containing protein [Methanogenium sp. S4BF]